ncbi:MAG TPA: hypothetical protein VL201_03575 [Patescibacteria group bacterium]|jgi:hypothetical protein|nr:hypothetical protein [Patescibacteria group bacterium]
MNKPNFIHTIPLHTYIALNRWFRFSICLFFFFITGCCIIDLPLVWQWYQKKRLYDKQKNMYTKLQEIVVQEEALRSEIKNLGQQESATLIEKCESVDFLRTIFENKHHIEITSAKKANKTVALEGIGPDIDTITEGLKKLAAETKYILTLQSVERKYATYVFHALCRPQK